MIILGHNNLILFFEGWYSYDRGIFNVEGNSFEVSFISWFHFYHYTGSNQVRFQVKEALFDV